MLPAADGRHDRVAEIVLAVGGLLDVRPFEVGAAAAVDTLLAGRVE
jgi:hypothetical protein